MKGITKIFCLLLVVVSLLSSCNSDPKKKLIGEWKEYCGVGQETDVDYSDTYKIQLTADNEIILSCTSRDNYLFDKILFDGNELSFRKENTIDPNEKFYVYYKLKLSKDGEWMEGPISNSRNQTDYVKWKKIH